MILTVILNCASEPANLPVFEAANTSDTLIKFVQHPILEVAILGKLALSFLIPTLTNEQYALLKLTHDEAEHLVAEISKAACSSDLRTDDHSVVELLTFLLNFTKQSGTVVLQGNDDQQKRKVSSFFMTFKQRINVSESNTQKLVDLGIMKILESLINKAAANVTEKSLELVWNLLHDDTTMKLISPLVSNILANIHFEASTCAKSLILCIQWLIGGANKSGKIEYLQTDLTTLGIARYSLKIVYVISSA